PRPPLFPYTSLFRSRARAGIAARFRDAPSAIRVRPRPICIARTPRGTPRAARLRRTARADAAVEPILMRILGLSAHYHDSAAALDRKSTRLNSSHVA